MFGIWGIPPDSFIVGRTDGNSIEDQSPWLFFSTLHFNDCWFYSLGGLVLEDQRGKINHKRKRQSNGCKNCWVFMLLVKSVLLFSNTKYCFGRRKWYLFRMIIIYFCVRSHFTGSYAEKLHKKDPRLWRSRTSRCLIVTWQYIIELLNQCYRLSVMGVSSWGTEMKNFTVEATPEQDLEEWIGVCQVRMLRTRSADSFWPITGFPCIFHLPLLSLHWCPRRKATENAELE